MVSTLTALILKTRDDIVCTAGGPTKDGKYVGWITLGVEDRFRPLLNSEPIYDSAEDATAAMRRTVEEIRALPD